VFRSFLAEGTGWDGMGRRVIGEEGTELLAQLGFDKSPRKRKESLRVNVLMILCGKRGVKRRRKKIHTRREPQ